MCGLPFKRSCQNSIIVFLFLVSTKSMLGTTEGDLIWLTCMICMPDGEGPMGAPGATASVPAGAEQEVGGAKAIETAFMQVLLKGAKGAGAFPFRGSATVLAGGSIMGGAGEA
uniref:Secreted protein n=1 Tax=Arundo donax TaxID=35708 RepID=A0A0A9I2X8_ARUDO